MLAFMPYYAVSNSHNANATAPNAAAPAMMMLLPALLLGATEELVGDGDAGDAGLLAAALVLASVWALELCVVIVSLDAGSPAVMVMLATIAA